MLSTSRRAAFRQRVIDRQPLLGSLVKLPASAVVEILGLGNLDFVVLDAEHAPLDRGILDTLLLAAAVVDLPSLVRLASPCPADAQQALDCGATGLVVPRVSTVEAATAAVSLARYAAGRGYSNSPRAGQYTGTSMAELIELADRQTTLLCQIEDSVGVANARAIASVEGVDGLLIGPADLALSLGATRLEDETVDRAIETVLASAFPMATGLFQPDLRNVATLRDQGASLFVTSSDVGLLRKAVSNLRAEFDAKL